MRRNVIAHILIGAILVLPVTVLSQQQTDTPNETPASAEKAESKPTFSENSTVDDYLKYALQNNRALKSAILMHESKAEKVNQAGWVKNPELSYEYMFEQHDMQYRVGLSQKIPGFGKLRLKKSIARATAAASLYDSDNVRLMVFENLIKAFFNYHYLGRVTEVTEENIMLLDELEKVLLSRYKVGKSGYSDVLKVQVEKDRLLNERESLKDMRSVKSAKLCAILNIPTETILPWPKATRSADTTLSADVLMDLLESLNPELKAIDSMIEGLAMSEDLAKKEYWPDFMVGAGYHLMPETESGKTPSDTGVMLGITLPLWFGKNKSASREAALAREASVYRRKQMEDDLIVDLKQALFDLNDAERQINLLNKSLVPKAQQAFEVAKKEFMTGSTPFMTLIDAQRTLFDLSLKLERAMADREIALGEIGCCVGKYDLKALQDEGSN